VTKVLAITNIHTEIGVRLAGRARAAGMRVRAMDPLGLSSELIRGLHVDMRKGTLHDRDALASFLRGVDVVVHCAGAPRNLSSWRELRAHHVDGTDCLASEARRAGVRRLVHLSSLPTTGDIAEGRVEGLGIARYGADAFQQTSLEGERLAVRHHRANDFEVLVLRSADIYGPAGVDWVLRPLDLMRRGLMMLPSGDGGVMNPVFVDNLCDAVFAGMRTGYTGQAFNITDELTVPLDTYFGGLAEVADCRAPRRVPRPMHRALHSVLRRGARLVGMHRPMATLPSRVHGARRGYTTRNARELLRHRPQVQLADGLKKTQRWLRSEGHLLVGREARLDRVL